MKSPTAKSILLIDDDEISNLFNKIFIGKLDLNVHVEVAMHGKEAIQRLKANKAASATTHLMPRLILLDIRMPIMDGWAFLDAYANLFDEDTRSQIVIVMLTTSEDETDMVKAAANPYVKEVLKKPLSEKKFSMLIKKFFVEEKTV